MRFKVALPLELTLTFSVVVLTAGCAANMLGAAVGSRELFNVADQTAPANVDLRVAMEGRQFGAMPGTRVLLTGAEETMQENAFSLLAELAHPDYVTVYNPNSHPLEFYIDGYRHYLLAPNEYVRVGTGGRSEVTGTISAGGQSQSAPLQKGRVYLLDVSEGTWVFMVLAVAV